MAIVCVCRVANILTWFDEILNLFEKTFDWFFSMWQNSLLTLADCLMPLGIVLNGQIWKDIWSHCSSALWPHLAKFRHFCKNYKVFGNIWKSNLVFGEILNLFWQSSYAIGHILIVANDQNITKHFCHLVTLLPSYLHFLNLTIPLKSCLTFIAQTHFLGSAKISWNSNRHIIFSIVKV